MSTMKQGVTFFNSEDDRIDICFTNGDTYGGLHCGQCFDVLLNGVWMPTSIEKAKDWYFTGLGGVSPVGQTVRM